MAAGMGGFLPPPVMSGISVTPETALTFTAVFSAINVLSTDVAGLPLEVWTTMPTGGRKRVPTDPRYDLLYCEPNEDSTSIRFRTAQMGHALAWGNSYSAIERLGDGTPAALRLLSPRPNDTRPERTRSGRLVYTTEGGRGPSLPAEDVIHVAGLGWDGLVGFSPIAMARQAIGLGIAAEQFGASFFGNGSTPKGVLKKPGKMNPEAMQRLRTQWEAVHQGTVNANRVAVLEEGLEWQNISIAPEDAQFLETRKFQVLEIARLYNLPPHKIGDYSMAHLANLEESNVDYLNTTLRPWLEAIEQELNRKFFSRDERARGLHVRHDMTALLRGNTAARTARNQAMRNGGALSADDWRTDEGQNPIGPEQGGDLYIVQGQYVPLADVGRPEPEPDPGDPAEPNEPPEPPETPAEPPADEPGEGDPE
jgi:HK97 family phage portal protein